MSTIPFEQFQEADIRIGTIKEAEAVPESNKLLKLSVDFGEKAPRQVISGIGKSVLPKGIIGLQAAFIINLEPREIMGLESQAMILAIDTPSKGLTFASPSIPIEPGSKLH